MPYNKRIPFLVVEPVVTNDSLHLPNFVKCSNSSARDIK